MNIDFAIKRLFYLVFPCIYLLLFSSCASYKQPTTAFLTSETSVGIANEETALSHPLYLVIPRHRDQIKWYDAGHWCTWMLFGNDDDGIFGEGCHASYKPERPATWQKAACWGLRNPLHNFTFYVIGSAHRQNSELAMIKIGDGHCGTLEYMPEGGCTFAGEGTSFFLGLHGGKPFISLRLAYGKRWRSDFYIGWRARGNFGIKCNLLSKAKDS